MALNAFLHVHVDDVVAPWLLGFDSGRGGTTLLLQWLVLLVFTSRPKSPWRVIFKHPVSNYIFECLFRLHILSIISSNLTSVTYRLNLKVSLKVKI